MVRGREEFMRTKAILILVFAAALAPAAQPAGDGGTVATIRRLEREWAEAQGRNDNRALDLIFDNALVYVEYGKLVSKGDYLSRIREEAPGIDQVEMDPMTVRTFGSTAIVVGTYRERRVRAGQVVLKRWHFVDTWVYKKNGWVLVAAAAAPILD
jgi:hypothetical protein